MSRIDVHHHFYPEAFTRALIKAGGDPSGWTIPPWTLEADQQLAKDIEIKTAILSVTAPGPCIERDPKAAAKLARTVNEAAATIRNQHPSSYGFFASLPSLLNEKEALEELAYALDDLKADGVIIFTRYGEDNHYLGHADFRPIWIELNKRKAVVFIHPTHAVDTNLVNSHLPQPMFDYPQETGRTAIDMMLSNTLPLVKDCKVILSHAGGTLPYLIDRVAGMIPHTQFTVNKSTAELTEDAKQFYFDTALSSNPLVLDHLLGFAKDGHVLFGSDFPNAPTGGIGYFTRNLDDHVSEVMKQKICGDNALKLFPRLGK
ncbi:amidohydrolase family protein [Cadophora sp. DSE1049]|nr:amidohydrolase family protein [Cadophora sp. DSE1049]